MLNNDQINFETYYNIDDECRYWYATGYVSADELYNELLKKYKLENTDYVLIESNQENTTSIRVKVVK